MRLLLKNLLFTILVPGTVAVVVPYMIGSARTGTLPWSVPRHWAALPFVVGVAIYLRCVWDFAITGRGTPAPVDPPKVLVVRGLFRYVRNPFYIGVIAVIVGWAVYFASQGVLIYAVGVALMFHLFVVLLEEPQLRRQFGEGYEQYCRNVRRWIPRIRPIAS